jgi:hypothetical protein
MRQTFTAIFKRTTTERLWTWDASVLKVWLWLRLNCDEEGNVAATPTGIALQANVSDTEVRAALARLESPDPDVDTEADSYQGRYIIRVDGGYRIVGYASQLEEMKLAKRRSRQRDYMRERRVSQRELRDSQNDNAEPEWAPECQLSPIPSRASDPDPDLKIPPQKEGTPYPAPGSRANGTNPRAEGTNPRAMGTNPRALAFEAESRVVRPTTNSLAGWEPSDELRAEARIAGVLRLDDHLASLRSGPIGGSRGVFVDELDTYVRAFFGKWKTWEETDRAKAAGQRGAPAPEPPKAATVPGCPVWVAQKHAALADELGLDVKAAAAAFSRGYHLPVNGLRPADLFEPFRSFLVKNAPHSPEAA